jgi:hypothetical protein
VLLKISKTKITLSGSVLYTLPEDPRYRIRLVCLRENDLLSSKASAALKTADISTHCRAIIETLKHDSSAQKHGLGNYNPHKAIS